MELFIRQLYPFCGSFVARSGRSDLAWGRKKNQRTVCPLGDGNSEFASQEIFMPLPKSIRFVFHTLLILCGPSLLYAQGFKDWKQSETITVLKRKLAAFVVIRNKRIKLIATAQGNTPKEVAEVLLTKLRTDVQKDTGFIEDERNPETILRFTVTAFDIEHRQGTRLSGKNTVPYTLVTGNIEVSYQAIEVRTNAPVDSENLTATFKRDYPPADAGGLGGLNPFVKKDNSLPPSRSEMQSYLLNTVASLMAQRAAPVEQTFTVPLPRGKFDQLSKVAQTQSWGKVLEGAETMAPLPDAKDDSYRQYLIGLANEALAYQQKTNDATRDYLFKARKSYDEAKMRHPKEDRFLEPWTRVDKAVEQYDKIKRQEQEYRQFAASRGSAPVPKPASEPKPVTAPPKDRETTAASDGASDQWNNQMVIKLWKSGSVKEADLIEFIKTATNYKFDVNAPQALLELSTAGVPSGVIRVMREKMAPATNKTTPPKKRP
jgi:hypothetical protein